MSAIIRRLASVSARIVQRFGGPKIGGGLDEGVVAPALVAQSWLNVDGEDRDIHEILTGRPVFVEFWSTQCKPCVAAVSKIREAHSGYATKGLKIVTIHVNLREPNPRLSEIRQFLRASAITYPVGIDFSGESWRQFQFTHLPHGVLLAADGKVSWSGSLFNYHIEDVLLRFFGEPEPVDAMTNSVLTTEAVPDLTHQCDGGACELPNRNLEPG